MKLVLRYKLEIGSYRRYFVCRFCKKAPLCKVIDLGHVPLAGGFLKNNDKKTFQTEKSYPLELSFCKKCSLLQTTNVINADTLFKNYFYFSSSIKTLTQHFVNNAKEIKKLFKKPSNHFILEIGCNDASMLKALLEYGFRVLGVDPATNITAPLIKKGLPIINDYFSQKLAKEIHKKHGKADVILSYNTLAHIEDMHSVLSGIKELLKKDGILIFEVHYLGSLIKELQYDMIYHEHQYYYSLLSLIKFLSLFDLEVYDVCEIKTHAGSIRVFAQAKKSGKHKKTNMVKTMVKKEMHDGLDKLETFVKFNSTIKKNKSKLLHLLQTLKSQGKKIVGYGASGRGTILSNYCGLTSEYLDYVIDDAPAKIGKYTPGTHLEIKASSMLFHKNPPDYVVLFAWSFLDEIRNRNEKYIQQGGKFIIPLPHPTIIP